MGEPETDGASVVAKVFKRFFFPRSNVKHTRGTLRLTPVAAPLQYEDLVDIEAINNPDGSITILYKDKDTGEKTGELHVQPGPEKNSGKMTARDTDGTEWTLEMGSTSNPDGSVTYRVESNHDGYGHSTGEITIRNDTDGHPSSADITFTDNGETNTITIGLNSDGSLKKDNDGNVIYSPSPEKPAPEPSPEPKAEPEPEPDNVSPKNDDGTGRRGDRDGGAFDGPGIIDDRPIGGDGKPINDRNA